MSSWIIRHAETGAVDGIYFSEALAAEVLQYWRAVGAGEWTLQRVDGIAERPTPADVAAAVRALARGGLLDAEIAELVGLDLGSTRQAIAAGAAITTARST